MHILYHASPEKNLELIEPRPTLSNDKYIGDYVFATANRLLAVMYLATKGVATLMDVENSWIAICCNEGEYIANDKGGAIYTLPMNSFIETPQTSLNDYEFVSTRAVRPTSKIEYTSTLQAMIDGDITVFFVDEPTFNDLLESGESPLIRIIKSCDKKV